VERGVIAVPSRMVPSLPSSAPPALRNAGPMLLAVPWSAARKLPWTTAAPVLLSPNWTSATMFESSTTRPQPWHTPSSMFGLSQWGLGQAFLRDRPFFSAAAAAAAAFLLVNIVGAVIGGRGCLRGFGTRGGAGLGWRPMVAGFESCELQLRSGLVPRDPAMARQ
jgi:hypothetical protein